MAGKKSVSQWEDLFKQADKDGSGFLDVFELRDLLKQGNCKVTDSQIADTFVFFEGPTGDKKISKDEFVTGMKKFEDFFAKLGALFKQADSDGSGYLDKNELRKLLGSCGHNFTDAEINEILKEADKSGDGKISFQEFLEACT